MTPEELAPFDGPDDPAVADAEDFWRRIYWRWIVKDDRDGSRLSSQAYEESKDPPSPCSLIRSSEGTIEQVQKSQDDSVGAVTVLARFGHTTSSSFGTPTPKNQVISIWWGRTTSTIRPTNIHASSLRKPRDMWRAGSGVAAILRRGDARADPAPGVFVGLWPTLAEWSTHARQHRRIRVPVAQATAHQPSPTCNATPPAAENDSK